MTREASNADISLTGSELRRLWANQDGIDFAAGVPLFRSW
jgi:hypothetical protein